MPSRKVLQLHRSLSKKRSALHVQLRTEKIGFKDFLFYRSVPGNRDQMCECWEGPLTVAHVLLTCTQTGTPTLSRTERSPGNLNECKLAIKAIRFTEQTRILGQFGIANEYTRRMYVGGRRKTRRSR